MSDEPFSSFGGIMMQSGVPVRIKDSGGQGNWLRVPQPLGGEVGEILTVQPDLSAAWEPSDLPPVGDDGDVLTVVAGAAAWAPPSGGGTTITTVTTTVSNANLKAGSVVTIAPAPGAGLMTVPISITFLLQYGGTNAFTNSPNHWILGGGGLEQQYPFTWTVTNQRCLVAQLTSVSPGSQANTDWTYFPAAPLTGNAANNNTLKIIFSYITVAV